MITAADLPDDIDALKARILVVEARNQRLEALVAAFKQALFGRKSERLDPDQFDLALEDIESGIATLHAEEDAEDPAAKRPAKVRAANRGSLPKHLPRLEEVLEPASLVCACGGGLQCIGEDISERLDIVPAQVRVLVTRRPKYACRACTDGVVQAPAPARLIPSGIPTEATVAQVLVSKYADHLPLYRQAQIYSRQGIDLDRSTLADWVGRAGFELRPVYEALLVNLKRSTKLFMDETRAPVLDPGARKTKTGYFWALARDDRAWGGTEPPGVAFTYAPGRGGHHADRILSGFGGILQVDGYAGYNRLIAPDRTGPAPIAEEGLALIRALYAIEADIRGCDPAARLAARQERATPILARLDAWLQHYRFRASAKAPLGEALAYIAKYRDGLGRFLTDGRVEIDNNAVERTIRPIALNRKNALFAGHDTGAENWAVIASLIETCKMNGIEPQAWLTATLTAIVKGHKQSQIDDLLPWNYHDNV